MRRATTSQPTVASGAEWPSEHWDCLSSLKNLPAHWTRTQSSLRIATLAAEFTDTRIAFVAIAAVARTSGVIVVTFGALFVIALHGAV